MVEYTNKARALNSTLIEPILGPMVSYFRGSVTFQNGHWFASPTRFTWAYIGHESRMEMPCLGISNVTWTTSFRHTLRTPPVVVDLSCCSETLPPGSLVQRTKPCKNLFQITEFSFQTLVRISDLE